MLYFDGVHLWSKNLALLHDYAQRLGMKREWFQWHYKHPHYDIFSIAKKNLIHHDFKVNKIRSQDMVLLQQDNPPVVRSLCWNQPYASLMLHGKVETRPKQTGVRGTVLIYSAKKPYPFNMVKAISGKMTTAVLSVLMDEHSSTLNGYALGIGELVDCQPMMPDDEQLTFVEYDTANPRWCWIFKHVYRIRPFRYESVDPDTQHVTSLGKQGWGFVPTDTLKQVRLELE